MLYFKNTRAILLAKSVNGGDIRWMVEPYPDGPLLRFGYLWNLDGHRYIFLPSCALAARHIWTVGTEAELLAVIGTAVGIVFPVGPVL